MPAPCKRGPHGRPVLPDAGDLLRITTAGGGGGQRGIGAREDAALTHAFRTFASRPAQAGSHADAAAEHPLRRGRPAAGQRPAHSLTAQTSSSGRGLALACRSYTASRLHCIAAWQEEHITLQHALMHPVHAISGHMVTWLHSGPFGGSGFTVRSPSFSPAESRAACTARLLRAPSGKVGSSDPRSQGAQDVYFSKEWITSLGQLATLPLDLCVLNV